MKKILSLTIIALIVLMLFPVISSANSSYTEWTDATTLPTQSGSYKLACDVTITTSVTIPKNSTVTLDLNGYTVKVNGSSGNYFVQGTLKLEDSKGNGKITNDGFSSTSGNVIYVMGNCQINGGTIENTISSGYALYINGSSAICTLNNGTILNSYTKGAKAIKVNNSNAKFIMNGGKVESKAAGSTGVTSAIEGNKIIVTGGIIEAAGTAIEATGESVEITGGTIKAGWFGLHTRYATIKPEEGKTVKITAGRAAIIAYSAPAAGKGNKIYGGTFEAPVLMESIYACDPTNVEVYGGLFTSDVSDYKASGYRVNYPVYNDELNKDMYEVKLNTPNVTQDAIKTPDGDFEMLVDFPAIEGEPEKIFEKEIDKNEKLKEALLDGKSVNIEVQMEKLEEKDINEEELKAIKDAAKEGEFVKFYDITLVMIADKTENLGTIPEISNKLTFKVLVPEELVKDGRTFFMYRYHEGANGAEVEKLTGEINEENYFIFESDKFSTYALAYEDKVEEPTAGGQGTAEQEPAKKDETPKTGAFDIALYVLGAIALVSVVGTIKAKKPGKYSK